MNNSLLSVIVPVYKVEQYLDRCIQSIVNQTYTNLEIILVDDGSPDNCPQICDEWAKKDSRIKVIHKENGGQSSARNAGIDVASGDYISFIDSDDYIDLKMYEKMVSAFEDKEVDMVCCGVSHVKLDSIVDTCCLNNIKFYTGVEALKDYMLNNGMTTSPCDKIYKKEILGNVKFPEGEIYEDFAIIPYLFLKCKKIVHVGESLYYYYRIGESTTRSGYSENKRIILKHLDNLEQYLKEQHKELYKYFEVVQAMTCQSNLYLLLDNKKVRNKYKDDYNEFYKRFKKSFKAYIRLGKINKSEKIKAYLIYYRLYYFVHKLKKII